MTSVNDPDPLQGLEPHACGVLEAADRAGLGVLALAADGTATLRYINVAALQLLVTWPAAANLAVGAGCHELLAQLSSRLPADPPHRFRVGWTDPVSSCHVIEVSWSAVDHGAERLHVFFVVGAADRTHTRDAPPAAEPRFRSLIESVQQAVWLSLHGRIIYANASAAFLFGFANTSELAQRELAQLLDVDDPRVVAAHADAMSSARERRPAYECRARTATGAILTLEVSSQPIEFGNAQCIVSFARDVTSRKEAEQSLRRNDRLSALGMLAGGMAHAINIPVADVLLNLDQLSKELTRLAALRTDATEALGLIRLTYEGATRVARVVERMRDFCRSDGSSRGAVDVTSTLRSVLELVGNEIRHRGQLVQNHADAALACAPRARLEQALLHLLIHSARCLPEHAVEGNAVEVSSRRERDSVVIDVICTSSALGCDSYARPGTETDLGLLACEEILCGLGGSLSRSVSPGRVQFRVELPTATGASAVPEPPSFDSPVPAEGTRARILVVDDDPDVSRALRMMFEDDHEVTCVESVRQALRLLLSDVIYDLIFCNLMMPDLTGMDLFQVIRFNRPGHERRLIFMTAGVFTAEAAQFLQQVSNPRLEKPFELHEVRRVANDALSRP